MSRYFRIATAGFFALQTVALIGLTVAGLVAFKRSWRFTIRAILIATTLVAAVLGIGVYLL